MDEWESRSEGEDDMTISGTVTDAGSSEGRRIRLLMENADGRRVIATRTSWLDMKVFVDGTCVPMVGPSSRISLSDRNHSGVFLLRTAKGLFLTTYPVGLEPGRTCGAVISIASRVFHPEFFRAYPIPQGFVCREATFVVIPDDYPEAADPSVELTSRVTPDPKGVLDPWGTLCDALIRNFRANRVFPQRSETPSNEYPDDRGSAGRVQPVFSIRCHGREVALRRLSRTLTWIGSDRNASVPILHPSVSPTQCAVLWDGATVTVIGTLGTSGMRRTQPAGYGSTALTEFQAGRFRPGETLRIGVDGEVEIHFPGFTQSTIAGTSHETTPSISTYSASPPTSPVASPQTTASLPLVASTLSTPSTPASPRTVRIGEVGSEPVGSVNVVLAPLPSRPGPDAFRQQRESLERQLEAYRQQQERLWRQQQEVERFRVEVMAQRAELTAWREKLEQERTVQERQRTELAQERLRQATETQRIQAEQSAQTEEHRQFQLQREELERQRQSLVEERAAWLTWRRRYEAQMFRLAAEFAERNAGGAGRMANVANSTANPAEMVNLANLANMANRINPMDPMGIGAGTTSGTLNGAEPPNRVGLGDGSNAALDGTARDFEAVPTPFLFSTPFAGTFSTSDSSISTPENLGGVFAQSTTPRSQTSPMSPPSSSSEYDYGSGSVSRMDVLRAGSAPLAGVVQTDTEQLSPDFRTPSPWSTRSPKSQPE